MEMAARGGRDVKPLFLKLGFALALSVAGYFAANLPSRRRLNPPSSSLAPELEAGGKPASHGGFKDELRILRREEGLAKITTKTTTTTTTKTVAGLSPSSASSGGEEEFLLPEFNELVLKDFETSCKELDSTHSTPTRSDSKEDCSSVEQEISQLKNLVFSLQERERNLELQLPEYSGMLEREAAARELESQMKIHNMESQLFLLKIESLQSENQRLQALVLDHSRVMGELEAAKGKIKSLKRKAKLDGEQAWEKISSLHQMIGGLQNKERDDLEMERMLKELEGEAGSLGRRNSSLAVENLELKLKLESVETIFNSAMGGRKAEELEEVQQLKQSNDKLSKEVEQLQITRCSDVEELVYLRWVNACLRYELRNYQPPQGKMAARDLSKNLSPRSEEKAKQLILEYANSHTDGKGALSPGDLDDYSSSHASTGESDDVFLEDPSVNPKHGSSKSKLFSKLKKLVLGKDHRSSRVNDTFGRDSFESFSSSVTEEIGAVGQTPVDGLLNDERGGSGKHARPRKSLMDFQRLRRILLKGRERKGDSLKRAVSEDCLMGSAHSKVDGNRENEIPERKELRKYAEVLRGSHGAQMAFRKSTSSAIDDYLL